MMCCDSVQVLSYWQKLVADPRISKHERSCHRLEFGYLDMEIWITRSVRWRNLFLILNNARRYMYIKQNAVCCTYSLVELEPFYF